MDIIRLRPYRPNIHTYHGGNRDGSTLANDSLCRYALKYGVARRVIVCAPTRCRDSMSGFGLDRTEMCDPSTLRDRIDPNRSVFLTSMNGMVRAAQLRDALNLRVPICGIVHAVIFPDVFSTFLAMSHCLRECDRIVATSFAGLRATTALINRCETLIRVTAGATRPSILPSLLTTLPLGTDPTETCGVRKALARKVLDLPSNAVIFLYVGRVTADYKASLEPLLLAFAALNRNHLDAHCLIAGTLTDAVYGAFLQRRCAELGISERVSFLFNFPMMVRKAVYASADVFVSPADNVQETFGLSILEAMAAGLPVIASDWSGYRELVRHGHSGFLLPTYVNSDSFQVASAMLPLSFGVEPEAHIARNTIVDVGALEEFMLRLGTDADLRKELGDNGRSAVKARFAWKRVVHQYGRLWALQSQLASQSWTNDRCTYLDMSELFSGFASSNGNDLTVIKPSAEVLREVGGLSLDHGVHNPDELVSELELLFETERPLVAWRNEGQALWDALVSLLKAGALRLRSTGERH